MRNPVNRFVFPLVLLATLVSANASAQYADLVLGKWVIDSARAEPLDSGMAVPDVNAAMKNEVVQFNADGSYFTYVDTTRKAMYRIGTPQTPLLVIESKPDAAIPFRSEAEILTLDARQLLLRMFTPEYTMYVHYRKADR